ncbi:hypothetical protein HFD98_21265 [Pseudomonas sp. EKM23D]|uniref:hypothetical protein n=1 Tax=Pseudomonas TaxID=286 RepID=UPI00142E2C8C|nr:MULTISPECIES: hypothetical protein [Pseudomonas]KAF6687867.1 hypothetical protein HFD98_21265 [Pseudomonas sp. EKM23D]QKJ71462.1 hypothetical protein HRH33_02385 [Pseudomonas rhodesiae]
MRYPFSGIIVRYRKPQQGVCQFPDGEIPRAQQSSANSLSNDASSNTDSGTTDQADKTLCAVCSEELVEKINSEEKPPHETRLRDELHINIWEVGKKPAGPFMDIGVMISDRQNTGFIQVDLPWEVSKKDISDLGAKLNGEKSVAAIFNEVVHYDGFAEGNFANISFRKDGKDQKPFSLLRLNSELFKIEYVNLSNGTTSSRLLVEIPRTHPSTLSPDRRISAYVRFRIRNVPKEIYTSTFSQKDRTLISSRTEMRIVDFRINVRRGVPEELLSGSETVDFPQFERIHCFLTTDRSEDCSSQGKTYNGYRSLMDEDVWNEYIRLDHRERISEENSVSNYLGHQWTASDDRGVKDLIVLGRFSKNKSGLLLMTRFVLLGILFGATGNGLWEYFPKCMSNYSCDDCVTSASKMAAFIIIGVFLMLIEPAIDMTKKFASRLHRKIKSLLPYRS